VKKTHASSWDYLSHFSIQDSLLPVPTPHDRWWYSSLVHCPYRTLQNVSRSLLYFIFIMPISKGPPLLSSGQCSWVQLQSSGFDSQSYQILWEAVDLERGPLSLVSTTEEVLERKSSGSCLESREYDRRDPLPWPRGILYPQKLVLTPPTGGGSSVRMVLSKIQTTEFVCFLFKGT
jgi:hypothetical protein